MSTALVPTTADRPLWVTDADGWRVYIHVHDADYRREAARFKALLARTHPDRKGGSATAFRQADMQRARWRATEHSWYAALGLVPPDAITTSRATPPPPQEPRPFSAGLQERMLDVLLDRQWHTAAEIATAYGHGPLLPSRMHQALWRLRKRGSVIERSSNGLYRLTVLGRRAHGGCACARVRVVLSDGRPHSVRSVQRLARPLKHHTFFAVISKLRARGVPIVRLVYPDQTVAYQLAVDRVTAEEDAA